MNAKGKFFLLFVLGFLLKACATSPSLTPTSTPSILSGKLTFAGSTTMQPLAERLSQVFREDNPLVQFEIAAGGSKVGINAVHEGTADIGMSSRALSAEEEEGIQVYTVGLDALAIIVHPQNTINGLTLEQLRDIYWGKITNWKEVGGADLPIIPIQREISSGTRGAFDEIVLEKVEASAPNLQTVVTAGDVASAVAQQEGSIGYVGFGNLEQNVRLIAINEVIPSPETIIAGSYNLYRPLSFLTGPLSNPLAEIFIQFVLSEEGQRYITEFGWIPVNR